MVDNGRGFHELSSSESSISQHIYPSHHPLQSPASRQGIEDATAKALSGVMCL